MPDLFAPKRRIERRYGRAIKKLFQAIIRAVRKSKTPQEIIKNLKDYANDPVFLADVQGLAFQMVTALFADGNRSWRKAASKGTRGKEIYAALKKELTGPVGNVYREAVRRNAYYISSLPLKLAERATEMAAKAYNEGRRADDVADEIQAKLGNLSYSRAMLIARTEVAKAATELTRARSEELGLGWYIWRTSEDERVRDSHKKMEDVIINWNDPPSPELLNRQPSEGYYHAGEIYNCRCYAEPIVDLDSVTWPHKVHQGGKITRMTRREFEKLGGVQT